MRPRPAPTTLWLFSRSVGIPPGARFDFKRADLIAAGFEVALIVVTPRIERLTDDPPRWIGMVATVLAVVLIMIGGLSAIEGEGHFDQSGVNIH